MHDPIDQLQRFGRAFVNQDRDFINEAAKRGIFAYIANGHDAQEMQSAIDIVLRRFAEYHDLEGAFARRRSPNGQRAS